MPDELEQLFHDNPNLVSILRQWDQPSMTPGQQPFTVQGEATAEDVDAWLAAHAGTRAPLSAPNSANLTGVPPQFANNGRAVPPAGGWEASTDDQGDQGGAPSPQGTPTGPGQYQPPPQETQPNAPGPLPGAPPTPPSAPPPEPPNPAEGMVQIGNRMVPLDQVQALLDFSEALEKNPEMQRRIAQAFEPAPASSPSPAAPPAPGWGQAPTPPVPPPGQAQGPAPSTPPTQTLPPELAAYSDDPAVVALWNRTGQLEMSLQSRLDTMQQFLQQQQMDYAAQQQAQVNGLVQRAQSSFARQYNLDEPTMQRLAGIAARLEVLPALAKGFNPRTGQYETPDVMTAVERSLELAYWQDPALRQAALNAQVEQQRNEQQRRARAGAVSGSSGSVPRQQAPAVPVSEEGRRAAATHEVAQMLAGEWSAPES